MIKKFVFYSLLILACPELTWAKAKVEQIIYQDIGEGQGAISIEISGNLVQAPELTLGPSMIQIALPDAYIWPKVEKKVKVGLADFDTTLMGYQYSKDLVRVRAILPFDLQKFKSLVKLTVSGNKIEVLFPKNNSSKGISEIKNPVSVIGRRKNIEQFDEDYLQNLLKEGEENKAKEKGRERTNVSGMLETPTRDRLTDELMETASEVKEIRKPLVKQEKQESIINQYIVKFLVFMGLVLALFYLVVTLFKKGVLNKGKLSFLNPGQMVSVINNTYLGPKRSLILVKVHNQVFLLGNSEAGINLISEVKDTMGILKKTELDTTGSNFDYNLEKKQDRDDLERRVKLKERQDLTELLERDSEDTVQLSKRASESKEKVKFSEQIKNKVKNLKPLQ